jgi:hypothetical protein
MPSPFPGMDPWLEAPDLFPGLHERLTISIQDALNAAMPPGYVATIKHVVWVDPELRREPDVALYGREGSSESDGGTATLPGLVAVGRKRQSDPIEEPYLEIRSDRGKRLVTAVEVISVTNKRAGREGRESYQQKQEEYSLAGVNLVEIDLLRRGPHVSAVPLARLRRRVGAFDYHISVLLAGKPQTYHAAGIRLTDRLPAIGIPLDVGASPVTIDLQPMLDTAYDRSRYTELFSYREPPDPPLTPDQQAWAAGILKEKGLIP